jgi:peptidoglycan-associated lipoprotein
MKQYPVAGKVLSILFATAFLAACSGNTKEDEAAAAAAAEAAAAEAAAAEAAREAERRAQAEASAAQRQLEQAAMSAGTVFYFDFDSSNLKPAAQMALDAHIALLKTNDRSVRLEGHTDERGTRDYNMALGERRANAVRDYMVVNGIASYRIETVSYGEEQPVAYGSGEANWSQNRRVELK